MMKYQMVVSFNNTAMATVIPGNGGITRLLIDTALTIEQHGEQHVANMVLEELREAPLSPGVKRLIDLISGETVEYPALLQQLEVIDECRALIESEAYRHARLQLRRYGPGNIIFDRALREIFCLVLDFAFNHTWITAKDVERLTPRQPNLTMMALGYMA